jgi:hypothetical protein
MLGVRRRRPLRPSTNSRPAGAGGAQQGTWRSPRCTIPVNDGPKGKSPADVLGLEYDWLGMDATSRVALFSTAGGSHAPPAFLLDPDAHERAIDAVLAMPPCTTARFAPELPPNRVNTWKLAAERGLFAYDGDVHGGPYRLVAAPWVPVQFDQLPAGVRLVVQGLRFSRIRFEDCRELRQDVLVSGEHAR